LNGFKAKGGHMKKIFVVSLILVSIFLIGNAENAFALEYCTCYQCTVRYSCGEGILWEDTDEVAICSIDNGFSEIGGNTSSHDGWGCLLGGISLFGSNKNFVGFGGSAWGENSGCSVEIRGRSMTVDLYHQSDCMTHWRCTKGEKCTVT
jgi:hypothetical protein